MDESIRSRIRHIFLSPRPNFALMTASELLGMPFRELKKEIADGSIVAVSTGMGQRLTREEMIVLAMRVWEQSVIEEALGDEAAAILPEAMRLVELRARIPRYQHDMLRVMAEWQGTSVDDVLARELEGVACTYSEELAAAVPGFTAAMRWPGVEGSTQMIPREPDEMDMDPKTAPELSAAWSREIERRVREIDEGTAELIDWEDIRKELFEEPI